MESACILPTVKQAVLAVVNWGVPQCLESVSPQLRDLLIRLRCWAGYFPGVEHQLIDYLSVDSIEVTKNSVYAALENKNVIGLWGMGGVGKTSLMRKINNEMGKYGNIFVIWVTVSHNTIDIKDIQKNIARRLCSSSKQFEEFNTNDEIRVRARIISDHLKKFKSLIIFDDVWEDLDFKKIGIDINDENLRCQIVLTTRDQDICRRLGAEQIKMYARLDETESWVFFRNYSDIDNNPNHLRIKHIAQEICRKCAGLPLAISVVAKTLRGEILESKWNGCLNFLNEDCPQRVPIYVVKNMYRLLKFSYERLEEDDLKMGFLLCSVFAQGQEIQLRDFICYDIGADKRVRQDRGQRSLNTYRDIFINLKRKGLLQDVVEEIEDEKENSARMHDVIRDVAISIAQNEFEGFFKIEKFIKWSSSIQNLNSTDRLQNINEVQFLSFNGNNILESIHPDFFEGMANLLFLDLRGTSISIKEFIETCLQKLAKLRVLMFKTLHQNITVDITDFFFLQHLSVLCLQNVHISELNQEFSKKLIHLRSIDFSNTVIDIIRPKFFWTLRNTLEELNMQGSYNKWKAFNQEDGDYVTFEELKDLKNLYSLHIDIDDKTIFSHEYAPSLVIPPVEYFSIRYLRVFDAQIVWSSNILTLPCVQLSNVAKWLQVLFEKTKKLYMYDFEIDNNSATQAISSAIEQDIVKLLCNLKSLEVGYCSKQKNFIQYNTQVDPILPKLEHLHLSIMVELENIFVNTGTQTIIPAKSFERLERIYIYSCDRLKFIFPWNVAECVVCLEELYISSCSELENIIEKDDQGVSGSKARTLFPKLRHLRLRDLPNLENVWKHECDEKSEMEWHSLEYLYVLDCEKLNRLFMGENSAPNLQFMYCRKEWFDKLLWEDRQTESRFNGVFFNTIFSIYINLIRVVFPSS